MKKLNQQPRAMVLAIAIALGFATIGAGCAPHNGNDNNTNPPATAPVTPNANTPNANTQGEPNDGYAGTGDSSQPVSDTWITTKVQAKLHTVDGLDNSDLHVETNNGVVSLSGRVATQMAKDAAVAAAKNIKGVKSVDTSRLTVSPDTNQ